MQSIFCRSVRSPSPSAFAMASTLFLGAEQGTRRGNLSAIAGSANKVIDLIPISYHANLCIFVVGHYQLAQTFYRARTTLRKLEEYQSRGTWPSEIQGIHILRIQFSKEYLNQYSNTGGMDVDMEEASTIVGSSSGSAAKEFLAEVEKDVLTFRSKMLLASVNARQAKITFLQSRLRRSAFQEKVLEIISRRYKELVALHNEDHTATTHSSKKDSSFLVMEKGLLT